MAAFNSEMVFFFFFLNKKTIMDKNNIIKCSMWASDSGTGPKQIRSFILLRKGPVWVILQWARPKISGQIK